MDHKQQEQVALHRWAVIAEAAGQKLTAAERGALVRRIAARAHTHPDGSSRRYSRGTSTGGCGRGARAGWRRCGPHRGLIPGRCAPTRSCSPKPRRCGWNCPAAPPRRSPRSCSTATGSPSRSGPSAGSCAAPGCTARPWPPSRRHTAATRPPGRTSGGSPMSWWARGCPGREGRARRGPGCSLWSGGPGESHPRAPTDPCVTVSRYTALVVLVIWRAGFTQAQWAKYRGQVAVASDQARMALFQVRCFLYLFISHRIR